MTAVEWLKSKVLYIVPSSQKDDLLTLFEQAKLMEKEQIMNAWEDGKGAFSTRQPEQYYKEQYES